MVQYGKYQKGVITKSLKNWDNLIDYFENQCVREPDDDDMNLSPSTQKPAEEAKAEVDFDDLSKSTNDAKDVDKIDFGHSLEPENHSSYQNTKQPKSDINDFGAINDFDAFDDQDDYGMNGKSKVKTEKKPLVEKEIASTKQSSPSKSALEQPQEKINGGTINPPDLNVISRF